MTIVRAMVLLLNGCLCIKRAQVASRLSLSVSPLRFNVIDKALEHAGLKQLQCTQIEQFKIYLAVLH